MALTNVFKNKKTELDNDVIRITHWQLELGVPEAIDEMIKRFEAKKKAEGLNVKIIQNPIPEKTYNQYITTQMIGGTPPDLIELGKFSRDMYGRYFLPLSEDIQKENPFITDKNPNLKGIPWQDTFNDGLRNQYNEEMQEYYGVGFSSFTVRMFYNKNIFRAAVGTDEPPKTLDELQLYCDKISDYGESIGKKISPIISSRHQLEMFSSRFMSSITSDLVRSFDVDYDGNCYPEETLSALISGAWTPQQEQYKAAIELVDELAQNFPVGFMGLGREDTNFAFIQGNAAMLTSGSWDAKSYQKNIMNQPEDKRFDVGVMDFPLVGPNHVKYGKYYDGKVSEANTGTGFAFGITRFTKHKDLCIEFLQFCTEPENNTLLNEFANWIPSVREAEVTPLLKPFEPNFVGYWGQMGFETGLKGRALEKKTLLALHLHVKLIMSNTPQDLWMSSQVKRLLIMHVV